MKRKLVLLLATFMCISLCACGGSESTSGDNNSETKQEESGFAPNQPAEPTETTEQEIEITLDNWQEYFEIKPVLKSFDFEKNAFDEIEDLAIEGRDAGTAFCLKEEYVDKFVSADIAVEINTNQADGALFKYNMGTGTYEMEYLNDFDKSVSYFNESVFNLTDKTYSEKVNDVECMIVQNGHMSVLGEIEGDIVNIYVLACPNSEVTRIQGTLYIKEIDIKEEVVGTVDISNMTVEEMQKYYDVEKYVGTPRIEKLKVGNYNKDSETVRLSNFEEVGNIKEYEIVVDNRLGEYKKYDCIITDNNTPYSWKDDVVVYIFIE